MTMKKMSVIANVLLLAWFFLDMIGFSFGNQMLVSPSWKEDGIFFAIFAAAFLFYLFKEKIGKFALLGWLAIWFVTQFFAHWYCTIAGPWEGKMRYFADTIKLIPSSTVYIPDLYHIVLHILILLAFFCTLAHGVQTWRKRV